MPFQLVKNTMTLDGPDPRQGAILAILVTSVNFRSSLRQTEGRQAYTVSYKNVASWIIAILQGVTTNTCGEIIQPQA